MRLRESRFDRVLLAAWGALFVFAPLSAVAAERVVLGEEFTATT